MAYVVCASYVARAGSESRIAEIIEAMAEASRAEPGCLQYQGHRSTSDPRRFFLYEMYIDPAAYVDHQTTDHFVRLILGEAVALLEVRERAFYEPIGALPHGV
jgi:quinol monooxygenase YgiN